MQLLFIADVSRRRVHLPEHDRSKPGRQIVTFLLIANVTMWIIYTFETQKGVANPVQVLFFITILFCYQYILCKLYKSYYSVTAGILWFFGVVNGTKSYSSFVYFPSFSFSCHSCRNMDDKLQATN